MPDRLEQAGFGEVYNLIRGTDPQPGASTLVDGAEVQIYDSAPGLG